MKLAVYNLIKSYSRNRAVDDVSLELGEGEVVGLLGPNGAGKTTIFYIIVGLLKADSGRVYVNSQEITYLSMHRRASLGICYLPQEPSIFDGLTVEENFLAVAELANIKNKKKVIQPLIEEFNLTGVLKTKGYNLSGGERRRVEVARSLILTPRFLLLDEPFTGIDPIGVDTLQEVIVKLKEKNLGILITDHRVKELLYITDRAYIIYKGKVLVEGRTQDLVENKLAKKIYLGEGFTI